MYDFEITQEKLRTQLLKHPEIKIGLVYGSFARNAATAQSDLDIAVAGDRKLSVEGVLQLSSELSNLLGREVDVLDLFSASGVILREALVEGKLIFVKDHALYADLIRRMLYNQADMMPNYRMILRTRRERFVYG